MEGKDVIEVEILINGHRHYNASAALCTKILSAVSYLVIRLIFVVRPLPTGRFDTGRRLSITIPSSVSYVD